LPLAPESIRRVKMKVGRGIEVSRTTAARSRTETVLQATKEDVSSTAFDVHFVYLVTYKPALLPRTALCLGQLVGIVLVVAQMEVVVLRITDGDKQDEGLNDGLRRRLRAKVLRLVSTQDALRLHFRSRTTGELLVEADDTLHADSVGRGANCLRRGDLGRDERRQRPPGCVAHFARVGDRPRIRRAKRMEATSPPSSGWIRVDAIEIVGGSNSMP